MSDVNPNCDGDHCADPGGQIKVYPLGGGGNLLLCRYCWRNENLYRVGRGKDTGAPANWPTVCWETAEVYK